MVELKLFFYSIHRPACAAALGLLGGVGSVLRLPRPVPQRPGQDMSHICLVGLARHRVLADACGDAGN